MIKNLQIEKGAYRLENNVNNNNNKNVTHTALTTEVSKRYTDYTENRLIYNSILYKTKNANKHTNYNTYGIHVKVNRVNSSSNAMLNKFVLRLVLNRLTG